MLKMETFNILNFQINFYIVLQLNNKLIFVDKWKNKIQFLVMKLIIKCNK